jgi:hypothetical protein
MSKRVRIPLKPVETEIQFPNMCVVCGQPPTGYVPIALRQKGAQIDEKQTHRGTVKTYHLYSVSGRIPYCEEHLKAARWGKWIMRIASLAALALTLYVIFGIVFPAATSPGENVSAEVYIVAILLMMLAGVVIFFPFIFLAQFISSWFIPSLRHMPILAGLTPFQLGVEPEFDTGVSGRRARLVLRMHNDEVADRVKDLNDGYFDTAGKSPKA